MGSKITRSKQFKLWFLRSDWENQTSSATGEQWLIIRLSMKEINDVVLSVTTEN